MKQKYLTILLSVLMSMVGAETFARRIAVENADGVTIYYVIGGIGSGSGGIRTPQYGMEAIYNNSANDGIPVVTVTSRVQYDIVFSPRYRSSSGDEDGYDYVGRVVIPETVIIEGITYAVKYIDDWAFYDCPELTEIVIPCSIDSIGVDAFRGCSGLEKIVVASDNPKYDSREDCNALIRTDSNELIAGCKNTHIPNSVTSIGNYAFSGCTSLTELTIPNSVTTIGRYAFSGCSGLTELIIPNSVTFIGGFAFEGCTSLTEIVFGSGVSDIAEFVFGGYPNSGLELLGCCTSLTSVSSLNTTPPSVNMYTFFAFAFTSQRPTLHVLPGCKSAYEQAEYWNAFYDIQEDATAGIESTIADKQGKTTIYTLDGKRLSTTNTDDLPKGIYVVNGKKVVVK